MMHEFNELRLPGLSGELAAAGFGDPDKPKILALHGWLDNAASFAPLAPLLSGYYVVALDFAGHGLSGRRPQGCNYHMADYIADVAHAVAGLGWQQFDLLGHSLGAGVATLYASLYPQQIGKLLLIDGIGPISGLPDSAVGRMRKAVDANLLHHQGNGRQPKVYPDWNKLLSARQLASPLAAESAALLLRRGTTEVSGGYTVNADPRLKHPSAIYLSEEVVREFISAVTSRSLLVLAEQGMVASRSITDERIARFRDLQVHRLPGQHHLHMDTPERVAEVILPFLHGVST